MTDRQAEREARRRWGEDHMAWHHAYAPPADGFHCLVGKMRGDIRDYWQVYGRGATWKQAFADADARGYRSNQQPEGR